MSDPLGWMRDEFRAIRDDIADARVVLARVEERLSGHEESSAQHRKIVESMDGRVQRLEHDRTRIVGLVGGLGLGSTDSTTHST